MHIILKRKPMQKLEQAILDTVAYADVFEYPLTQAEIHHFLIGYRASPYEVSQALQNLESHPGLLARKHGYYVLPGRAGLVAIRQRRQAVADCLWPKAIHYGRWISKLPFVRMVAVTGSLAMSNTDPGADLDYLVVTRAGRLWLTRAMVILVVRWAARQGITLCPNYILSEQALDIPEQNLFTAHELVQMVLVSGARTFAQMKRLNPWVETYLPNAYCHDRNDFTPDINPDLIQRFAEGLLLHPVIGWIEQWEMDRKIRRFRKEFGFNSETLFSPDCCKGHFDSHGESVIKAFNAHTLAPKDILI